MKADDKRVLPLEDELITSKEPERLLEYITRLVKTLTDNYIHLANIINLNDDVSGRWDLIQSQTASASASVDFDAKFSAAYNTYLLSFSAVAVASNSHLCVRVGASSSYDATGYIWALSFSDEDATDASVGSGAGSGNDATQMHIVRSMSSTANRFGDGYMYIINPFDAASRTMIHGISSCINSSAKFTSYAFSGHRSAGQANDSIQIRASTGNITSGKFFLYGSKA